MNIQKTPVYGNLRLSSPVFRDERGVFEIQWETNLLAVAGVHFVPENAHHSYNFKRGTIRAFHYQSAPFGQTKLVACVSGRLWDVAVDLRPDSPSYLQWAAVELAAGSGISHLIPAGCAHGFATLEDHTTVAYLIEGEYRPEHAQVLRWDDPAVGVRWPLTNPILSEKDRTAPDFKP